MYKQEGQSSGCRRSISKWAGQSKGRTRQPKGAHVVVLNGLTDFQGAQTVFLNGLADHQGANPVTELDGASPALPNVSTEAPAWTTPSVLK
ncbi:hypothetical protein PCANC_05695 [Puccinia coronata f. sp. avenae]|uniref:Uncharacterized protein n=1 Tax=Puccinia coronata f. sp. avenae TaxID=200324 RepID=A0A2N5SMF2_9BASI|nr:hypothetical protein PCASD_17065 [Puccinia coronata f. sp. avenae]PLW20215.1 hypothetical protein PCANC_09872 [Puccinia coronata f. sp. avenae]PLW37628.1 hypothetical protein PCASD_09049 [Puccinia coronata f. sp. avenae]PLW54856.1 hypothetical protein PCANC_05695 [Puccinia coronata f. sp. avenae]